MKKNIALLFLPVILLVLHGCTKPSASEKIASGQWACASWKVNTFETYGSLVTSLTVNFYSGGSMAYTLNGVPGTGSWAVNSDDTFSFSAGNLNGDHMEILQLDDNTFHLFGNGISNGDTAQYEYRFVK